MLREDVRRDLDEVGLQASVVPLAKHRRELVGGQAERVVQQVVRLGNELDVRVLDPVVNHLHEVAGTVGADVRAARNTIDLGGDRGEHVLDARVGPVRPAGHDARAVQCALLPTRDAAADVTQAELLHGRGATLRVLEEGVAAVDDGVSLFQDLRQRVDRFVDGGTSLDHDEHRARGLEDSREVFERVGGVKVAVLAERAHELVGTLAGPVVDGDAHAVRGEVAREVHAHGREAHDPHLLLGHSPNLLGREPQERGCWVGLAA